MSTIILAKIKATLNAIRIASDSLDLLKDSNELEQLPKPNKPKPSKGDQVFFRKKKREDMTPEEIATEEERIFSDYVTRIKLKKGIIILEEGKNDNEISLIKKMLSDILDQDDDSKQVLFEKAFARSILGRQDKKASKDPKLLRTMKDFSPEEIKEIEESLTHKDYPGEGMGWERTLPEGKKVYVITGRQLSFLSQCYENIKARKEQKKVYEELAKQKPKTYKIKTKSEPKDDSDLVIDSE